MSSLNTPHLFSVSRYRKSRGFGSLHNNNDFVQCRWCSVPWGKWVFSVCTEISGDVCWEESKSPQCNTSVASPRPWTQHLNCISRSLSPVPRLHHLAPEHNVFDCQTLAQTLPTFVKTDLISQAIRSSHNTQSLSSASSIQQLFHPKVPNPSTLLPRFGSRDPKATWSHPSKPWP